jgi:hypothetical protein
MGLLASRGCGFPCNSMSNKLSDNKNNGYVWQESHTQMSVNLSFPVVGSPYIASHSIAMSSATA